MSARRTRWIHGPRQLNVRQVDSALIVVVVDCVARVVVDRRCGARVAIHMIITRWRWGGFACCSGQCERYQFSFRDLKQAVNNAKLTVRVR